jgi:hypothetical protein
MKRHVVLPRWGSFLAGGRQPPEVESGHLGFNARRGRDGPTAALAQWQFLGGR